MSQTPTIGRIVHYRLTADDAEMINRRRSDFDAERAREVRPGYVGHIGNRVAQGDVYPATIVRVFGPADRPDAAVNLQVSLDGNDLYWATSRVEGDGPGTWRWPARV